MSDKCKHGLEMRRPNLDPEGTVYACPFGTCPCCKTHGPYIGANVDENNNWIDLCLECHEIECNGDDVGIQAELTAARRKEV